MTCRTKALLKLSIIAILISALLGCGRYFYKPAPEIESLRFESATELTQAIRSGEISSVDLLNYYLYRIRRYNDDVNAVVALDVKAARARAQEADKALARGENWGPLHGLPMTVKDVYAVVGMPATSGDPTFKNYIPKRNAIAVQRLIAAGAIVFGKTNVPYHGADIQSYNAIYGTTNNPWDLTRTPGGSSGGAAAALAAGFTPLDLGSDIGGSVRIPAHYTGVFGHKTTFGIVPRYGHIPPLPGLVPEGFMPMIPLFVAGPLARSADDLALALDVLTTPGQGEASADKPKLLPPRRNQFKDYRVAVWLTDPDPAAEIDAEVSAALQKMVEKLRSAGLVVEEAHPDIPLSVSNALWMEIYNKMMAGALPLPQELVARQKNQQARWAAFFKRYDVLLAPVTPTVAFPHDQEGTLMTRSMVVNGQAKPMIDSLSWTLMAVVSGLPATVAPVGLSDSGLPIGVQIMGDRFEDRTTIDFARGLSELCGGFTPPPGYEE